MNGSVKVNVNRKVPCKVAPKKTSTCVEDLEPYVGLVNVDSAGYNKTVVSLREAAQLQATWTSSIEAK